MGNWGSLRRLGGKGSPGKALLRHPVGKWNEHVCCSRVTVPAVDLHIGYSTIPYGGPSRRLMRYMYSLTDMREMC